MKKLHILLIIVTVFASCSDKKKNAFPRLTGFETDSIVFVNSKEMLQNESPIIAANFSNDVSIFKMFKGYFEYDKETKMYKGIKGAFFLKERDLSIFIDTTYEFTSKGLRFKNVLFSVNKKMLADSVHNKFYRNKVGFFEGYKLEQRNVLAYPVLFFNNSSKSIPFGDTSLYVSVIQEAKDFDGKWKPIEFSYTIGSCIPPLDLLLQPKHYSAASIIKYDGDFKTKIRVKYSDGQNFFYSNEINGKINRSQFNQKDLMKFVEDRKPGELSFYGSQRLKLMLLEKAD
ncbi:hypothetical protein NAT51_11095 [Flavobacterium amniphilum]|uniref:hypothetical protein n=1 Tax=Flavobacterium amniphilum TaxID=1834035 RepID=UPI002029CB16|nr:hypothetical protein [Flavobacterium amniphilum]MCL9806074.1 hypothetical protein [Flavobacterium amniphilum]